MFSYFPSDPIKNIKQIGGESQIYERDWGQILNSRALSSRYVLRLRKASGLITRLVLFDVAFSSRGKGARTDGKVTYHILG